MTKEEFIKQAKIIHGEKYDYSLVNFTYVKDRIRIICPIHGEFEQQVGVHLRGHGCKKCGHERTMDAQRFNKEVFIKRATALWNGKYDYTKVNWIDCNTPVTITCKEHGDFQQTVSNHLKGQCGCLQCRGKSKDFKVIRTFEDFKEKAIELFGNKFDFSKVDWQGSRKKITIICPEHGEFQVWPYQFLHNKFGCPQCNDGLKYTPEQFISVCKERHPEYDYSKTNYTGVLNKVTVTCQKHGDFEVTPTTILNGNGCPECNRERLLLSTDEYISRANKVHNNFYDYTNSKYDGWENKITIRCPKHGDFTISAGNHLHGQGCPICTQEDQKVSVGEEWICNYLNKHNLTYTRQYQLFLSEKARNSNIVLIDFAVPFNGRTYLLEYNGKQHYEYVKWFFPTVEDFEKQLRRDKVLREHCKKCSDKYELIEFRYDLDEQQLYARLDKIFNNASKCK